MNLKEFFDGNKSVAIGFSGGVDSSYLLYAGIKYGADIKAYYIKTAFQPEFEYKDALKMAEILGANIEIIEADILDNGEIAANPGNRCYFCKKVLFGLLKKHAEADGYTTIIDGTNFSDEWDDRPGMKALGELLVRSPLRECGITKNEIRKLSKEAGLFTWDKPSYACLATRIPAGIKITSEILKKIEVSEDFLFSLGFSDFRVRVTGNTAAKIQVRENQMEDIIKKRGEILNRLNNEFSDVFLDLIPRK